MRDHEASKATSRSARASRRQQLNRHARRAIVIAVVLFVGSQVALRVWIDTNKREYRDPIFEPRYRILEQQRAEKPASAATVIFLGSSTTLNGMRADLAEEKLTTELDRPIVSVNLGTLGGGPFTNLVHLKRLVRRGIRPDLLVMELNPIVYDDIAPNDVPRLPPECLERQDLDVVKEYSNDKSVDKQFWESFLFPVRGHRLAILSQAARIMVPYVDLLEPVENVDAHGYRPNRKVTDPNKIRDTKETREAMRPRLQNYHVNEQRIRALRELADLAEANHIPTLFYTFPVRPSLRPMYGPGLQTLLGEWRAIAEEHHFPMIDGIKWIDEDKFSDNFHLDHDGATQLTEMLLERAIVPIMKSSAYKDGTAPSPGEKKMTE
jgi:hypothetical protein